MTPILTSLAAYKESAMYYSNLDSKSRLAASHRGIMKGRFVDPWSILYLAIIFDFWLRWNICGGTADPEFPAARLTSSPVLSPVRLSLTTQGCHSQGCHCQLSIEAFPPQFRFASYIISGTQMCHTQGAPASIQHPSNILPASFQPPCDINIERSRTTRSIEPAWHWASRPWAPVTKRNYWKLHRATNKRLYDLSSDDVMLNYRTDIFHTKRKVMGWKRWMLSGIHTWPEPHWFWIPSAVDACALACTMHPIHSREGAALWSRVQLSTIARTITIATPMA